MLCLHVCMFNMCVPGPCRCQKMTSDPLEQELQVLWDAAWLLESKPGLLQEQSELWTSELPLQPLLIFLLFILLVVVLLETDLTEGRPWIHCVDQAGPEFTQITCLPALPSEFWDGSCAATMASTLGLFWDRSWAEDTVHLLSWQSAFLGSISSTEGQGSGKFLLCRFFWSGTHYIDQTPI